MPSARSRPAVRPRSYRRCCPDRRCPPLLYAAAPCAACALPCTARRPRASRHRCAAVVLPPPPSATATAANPHLHRAAVASDLASKPPRPAAPRRRCPHRARRRPPKLPRAHRRPTAPPRHAATAVTALLPEDYALLSFLCRKQNIFVAGTDTSSATLEYAMAELMRNPTVMVKVQEVRRVMGEKGKVEESDISRLKYLKSVVKETLRLHPAVPLLVPHETTEPATINGYDIPPKTRLIVNAWGIGREKSSWENPDEFIPERFADGRIDFRGHDFQFIPFGAGRRICPGLDFAIMTIELSLANLLYAFDWEVPNGTRKEDVDMDEGTGITVHLKTNLRLRASKYSYKEN